MGLVNLCDIFGLLGLSREYRGHFAVGGIFRFIFQRRVPFGNR